MPPLSTTSHKSYERYDIMSNLDSTRLREVLDYCPQTGVFTWRQQVRKTVSIGSVATANGGNGYLRIRVGRRVFQAHRLAWLYVHGVWPAHVIDHINGDRADNRIDNLRDVTPQVNIQNQRSPIRSSSSGLLGACKDKQSGKWRSQITIEGVTQYLGLFDTAQQAHEAYLSVKRQVHEGCTL